MKSIEYNQTLLALSHVTVRYGGVTAVDDVSLNVQPGQIFGLIGPNGAGKTTLIDAITGFTPYSGKVVFGGIPLDGVPVHKRTRLGIARTFQAGGVFDDLTIEENILVGERRSSAWRSILRAVLGGDFEPPRPETGAVINALQLGQLLTRYARELSTGQRKSVAIAQALAHRPTLLLLDEPAAGLDSTESAWLAERLRSIRDGGVTILIVDHDMDLMGTVCDEVLVLNFGRVIAVGSPDMALAHPEVVTAYLGTTAGGTQAGVR
jgi:ABC-type branched-subunit amino acid transport system ATPase component